jgi:uncharacterized protein (DUF302 family)
MENPGYRVETQKSFDEICCLLEKTSPEQGFRVLAIHDTQATLAEKGFKIAPLKIFEICNGGFAYRVLNKNIDAALFMPCKIVVRIEGDKTIITLAKPSMISSMLPGSGLEELSTEVERQIIGIIDAIK